MTEARDIEEIVEILLGYVEINRDCPRPLVANLIADWRAKKAEIERLNVALTNAGQLCVKKA